MKAFIPCAVIAIATGAFLISTQQHRIKAARIELARQEATSSDRQANLSVESVARVTVDDIARLRAENRDIHRLRGAITEARQKRKALEQMRAENADLKAKIEQAKANPNGMSAAPFPLSNKGQATPDAAIETMFWAMYQGDMEALSRLMPSLTDQFQRMPAEERTKTTMLLRVMAGTITKIEILDGNSTPDEAALNVKITRREGANLGGPAGRERSTFILRRTNEVWQVIAER